MADANGEISKNTVAAAHEENHSQEEQTEMIPHPPHHRLISTHDLSTKNDFLEEPSSSSSDQYEWTSSDETFELLHYCDMVLLSMSFNGSKLLQDFLARRDDRITGTIVGEVVKGVILVMTDGNGQHVFARMIESCSRLQLHVIVQELEKNPDSFIELSSHKIGLNSVKKLVRTLEKHRDMLSRIVSVLSEVFYELMTGRNSSSVILHCFQCLNSQQNKVLYEVAIEHFLALATHERGYLSLNNLIDCMKDEQQSRLVELIAEKAVALAHDSSGNFVIQHILKLGNRRIERRICRTLKGHYIGLSMNKRGSHLVEKCLMSGGVEGFVEEMMQSNRLAVLANDPYGNYVVQSALKVTKGKNEGLYKELVKKLKQHRDALPHGYAHNVFKYLHRQHSTSKVPIPRSSL